MVLKHKVVLGLLACQHRHAGGAIPHGRAHGLACKGSPSNDDDFLQQTSCVREGLACCMCSTSGNSCAADARYVSLVQRLLPLVVVCTLPLMS